MIGRYVGPHRHTIEDCIEQVLDRPNADPDDDAAKATRLTAQALNELASAGCFIADHGADPSPCPAHEDWAEAMLLAIKARRSYVAPAAPLPAPADR